MTLLRPLIIAAGLLLAWQGLVALTDVPPFILPGPAAVFQRGLASAGLLAHHALYTLIEILLGLVIGVAGGTLAALALSLSPGLRRWLLPVLIASQAIPVFALAPILVLWLGYGLTAKIVMAALIIFFPVTAALYDGLRQTDPEWLRLASVLAPGRPLAYLRYIRLPAALPAFGAGLRIAAAVAPIGAVIGEWVGASQGLGHLMLTANARMQVDLMFAALALLALMAVALFALADAVARKLAPWAPGSWKGPE